MTDRARLNYLNDTLFGPIAKTIDCDVLITSITPDAFQVQVLSPVPDDLHKAHSLTIILSSGERLNGTVAHVRRLENADLEFQIDI
ncbi:hypothetical protein SAMN04489798_4362 [Pseudomonas arsenicoxydans]|uniref:PilZ domain-containing protein n=1 Tax=Pseudomonas arsenicoxydans TaxID=702115 RepID=A0A1H0NZX7_9PSED|nr:hypothetical protein [Pseudomonas arsenicoxydans]SDO98066.1 hypothetical protein SAMN04489798_4362 [Pseudomonas arsenicoxydans]